MSKARTAEQKAKIDNFVKENIDALESMGRELRLQLIFLERQIKRDRNRLEAYEEEYGDTYYRPNTGGVGEEAEKGDPTSIMLRPAVAEFRTTIKSILDSLTLIETKLGVDTGKGLDVDPEEAEADDDWDVDEWFEKTRKKSVAKKGTKKKTKKEQ